jgi:hypothetical protein
MSYCIRVGEANVECQTRWVMFVQRLNPFSEYLTGSTFGIKVGNQALDKACQGCMGSVNLG